MSLVRLLTSGKSLVDLRSTVSRYRMRHKNPLPKFGSAANPFLHRSGSMDAPRATAPSVEPKTACASSPADGTAAGPVLPTITPSSRAPVTKAGANWLARLNPFAWLRKPKRAVPVAASSAVQPPVQAELSLENVKVVRNDLSDADVEVVAVKPAGQPVAKAAAAAAGKKAELTAVSVE